MPREEVASATIIAKKFNLYISGFRGGRAVYSLYRPEWARKIREIHNRLN